MVQEVGQGGDVGAVGIFRGAASSGHTVRVFDQPGVVGAGRRLVRQRFPGRIVGAEKPTPLVLVIPALGSVHGVVRTPPAFRRKDKRGGEPRTGISR